MKLPPTCALLVLVLNPLLPKCDAANVVFSDSAFDLANYTQLNFQSKPEISVETAQNLGAGNPSPSLEIRIVASSSFATLQGFIADAFTYDPAIQGTITSVDFTIDKFITTSSSSFRNVVWPLIQQGSKFYRAVIPIPSNQGVWQTGSRSSTADVFEQVDFSTGSFDGSAHPDFSGEQLRFGFFNESSNSSDGGFRNVQYDNLRVQVNAKVSNPAIWSVSAGGNGHAYEFVRADGIDWQAAQAAAASKSFAGHAGHLATVASAGENAFIDNLLSSVDATVPGSFNEVWLGGFQTPGASPANADWHWITGESWTYTNWDSDEPNDSAGGEEYLGMWTIGGDGPHGTWNDQGGPSDPFVTAIIRGYVVEYPIPEPSGIVFGIVFFSIVVSRRGIDKQSQL